MPRAGKDWLYFHTCSTIRFWPLHWVSLPKPSCIRERTKACLCLSIHQSRRRGSSKSDKVLHHILFFPTCSLKKESTSPPGHVRRHARSCLRKAGCPHLLYTKLSCEIPDRIEWFQPYSWDPTPPNDCPAETAPNPKSFLSLLHNLQNYPKRTARTLPVLALNGNAVECLVALDKQAESVCVCGLDRKSREAVYSKNQRFEPQTSCLPKFCLRSFNRYSQAQHFWSEDRASVLVYGMSEAVRFAFGSCLIEFQTRADNDSERTVRIPFHFARKINFAQFRYMVIQRTGKKEGSLWGWRASHSHPDSIGNRQSECCWSCWIDSLLGSEFSLLRHPGRQAPGSSARDGGPDLCWEGRSKRLSNFIFLTDAGLAVSTQASVHFWKMKPMLKTTRKKRLDAIFWEEALEESGLPLTDLCVCLILTEGQAGFHQMAMGRRAPKTPCW